MQTHTDSVASANTENLPVTIVPAVTTETAHHESHEPVKALPNTGKKILAAVVLLAIVLAVTFFVVSRHRAAAEKTLAAEANIAESTSPAVSVVTVQYGPPTHIITLPGETRAWYESTIYARVSGYLAKWEVDIGDHVKAGQVLATIDTPELDHQLMAAQAKESAAEAQVKLAQATAHFSQVTFARFKDAPKGVVSDLERDERDANYETSVARVAAAESDLNSTKADVENLQSMLAFQKVRAPYDGTITERRVDIGDLVTAGSTASTTSLFRMAQSDQLRVFVDVPQDTAPDIHDGDEATAVWNGQTFTGKVARNARAINLAAKTLRMEVDIPNSQLTLLPGAYLDVNFQTKEAKPLLMVPASALSFRSDGPAVAVVAEDGRVSFHPVVIGRDMGNVVEIASGISAGDRVAMNISNQIADGEHVTAAEVEDPAMPRPTTAATSAPNPAVAANAH
jgi:RND family efflux transporter MFP subunit